MNNYRGKHVSSAPWAVSSTASYRGRHQAKSRHRHTWIVVVFILVVVILGYPLLEAHLLQTETVSLKADDLPADANNLHIVYLSDIHYGYWYPEAELNRLIAKINALHPDLVLFGGDYATDNLSAIKFFKLLQSKGRIHARYGIYGIVGEDDRGESDFDLSQLTEAMANAGVEPLVNEVTPVYIGSAKIWIAGADDVLAGSPDLKSLAQSVSASDYVIFLSHNPSVIPDAQQLTDKNGSLGWFDLGLFGHTHGGQMMFFSSFLGIGDDVPSRYQSGWKKENRVDLLISNGVGTSVWPGRLLCFPQIHSIKISN